MKVVATNRRARYLYKILKKYEAGISLTGREIKSIRLGRVKLDQSFVRIKNSQVLLVNAFIAPYQAQKRRKVDSSRSRLLLLKKNESQNLKGYLTQKNLTIIPLRMYIKGNLAKVEIGLTRRRRKHEKRAAKKEKVIQRQMERELVEATTGKTIG